MQNRTGELTPNGFRKFTPDFWFAEPHKTKTICNNPEFAEKHLHRIAVMKDYHLGSTGDVDENGLKGWVVKGICVGCGKKFKKFNGFVADKQNTEK
jgi:hypothetical protein